MYRKVLLVVGAITLLAAFSAAPASAGRWVSVSCANPGNTVVDYIHGVTHVDVIWYGDTGSQVTNRDVKGGGRLLLATPNSATSYEAYLTVQGSVHRWYGSCD